MDKRDIFILTKPPHSQRTDLCLRLLERSKNSILYWPETGSTISWSHPIFKFPSGVMVLACQEDLLARGIQSSRRGKCG